MEKIFKGRIIDNEGSDKWYEFSLFDIQWSDHDSIRVKVNVKINSKSSLDSFIYILKDTISQYTGIKDSEGNRIFEGDYCDCEIYANVFSMKTEKHNGFVVFNEFEYCLEMQSDFFPVASWKLIRSAKLTGHNIHDGGE